MRIVELHKAGDRACGGKARGLARLLQAGLAVPPGFVVLGGWERNRGGEILKMRRRLPAGPLAVRSSAGDEDGESSSAAGQFDTFLGIDGDEGLLRAVERCFASRGGERALAYRRRFGPGGREGSGDMAVIVQSQVQGRVSGVLFTVDPVTGRAEGGALVVEACAGAGEDLVAGRVPATRIELPREGSPAAAADGLLEEDTLLALREQALAAERALGHPLDLEWTVDDRGRIHWLQARPITTLVTATCDEFDYRPRSPEQLFTRANVGEMLPGAATPLTIDIFGGAIDFAMRRLYLSVGGLSAADREEPFICTFSNHLFFNLSLMYKIIGRVAGTSPESLEVSLLGRRLQDAPQVAGKSLPLRLFNLARYVLYVSGHGRATRRLERLRDNAFIAAASGPAERLAAIEDFLPRYRQATALHMQVSARSGALNSALRQVLARAGLDASAQLEALGRLLSGIEGVESAGIVEALERIAAEVRRAREEGRLGGDDLSGWLREQRGREPAADLFAEFLERHGHRCVREAELRTREWRDDPAELVHTIAGISRRGERPRPAAAGSWRDNVAELCARHPRLSRRLLLYLVERARRAVAGREYSKSLLMLMTSRLRAACRGLASGLVAEGLLPDADLLFFFTRDEITRLVAGRRTAPLLARARARRRLLGEQEQRVFPDFFRGPPPRQPARAERREQQTPAGRVLTGVPASPGVAAGPVRLVRSQADARRLRAGEIMCARFTDVGWTPYYGIAGGLITEIGSSLSHGAVVAREYGLPLVTGLEGATEILRDGDRVELDGGSGRVVVLDD